MQKFEHGGDIKSVIRENNLNEIMDFSAISIPTVYLAI